MKQEIEKWLRNPDIRKGILLFRKYSRNTVLADSIEGNPGKYFGKLIVSLAKMAGYNLQQQVAMRDKILEGKKPSLKKAAINVDAKGPLPKTRTEDSLPEVIKKLINDTSAVYNERSMLHRQLTEVPDANTKANIKKRKELHELILACSDRLELMLKAKSDYFERDMLPKENEIWGKPAEIQTVDDGAGLMKRKKNLESSLSKDKNLLLFQSKTSQDKENPMPAGDYRDKIEARIKEKEKELAEINEKLK